MTFLVLFFQYPVSYTGGGVSKKDSLIASGVKLSHILSVLLNKASATKYSEVLHIWFTSIP